MSKNMKHTNVSLLVHISLVMALGLCVPGTAMGQDCGDAGAGDCYEVHASTGCDCAPCCELVCEQDPFCCDSEWDENCVKYARVSCSDCNENDVADECEVEGDCNENGVPDECEFTDCNDNGIFDECEFDSDCNGNGVPDECELKTRTSGYA